MYYFLEEKCFLLSHYHRLLSGNYHTNRCQSLQTNATVSLCQFLAQMLKIYHNSFCCGELGEIVSYYIKSRVSKDDATEGVEMTSVLVRLSMSVYEFKYNLPMNVLSFIVATLWPVSNQP